MTNSIKLLCVFVVFLLAVFDGRAQSLPLNGSGKCEMSEVVSTEGFSRLQLYSNEVQWFKGLPRSDVKLTALLKDSLEGRVSASVELLVYSQSGILRKLAGAITYRISVETKEGKYRYSFTDFVYHYYAQNRNYQIVKTGKTKPLEETHAKGWQKLWTQHRKTVFTLVNHQLNELKAKIVEPPKSVIAKEEKKVDW